MATLTSSFEGGSSGTTITIGNSGGASGNAFDVVTIGASATAAFDNAQAAHGTLSAKIATGASAVTSFLAWTTSEGSQAQIWFRLYLFITANPASVLRLFSGLQGSTGCASIGLTTTGLLRQLNATGATIQTGTVAVPANQWVRIEGFIIGSATVGQVEHKLFKSDDSTSPDETLTSAATQNTTGSLDTYRFGLATSLANAGPYWLDDIGLSSTGYLGPALVAFSGAAALSGTGALTGQPAVNLLAAASLSGTGALTSQPVVNFASAAALAGTGSLTSQPVVNFLAAATLSGSGSLTSQPVVSFLAAAVLAGTGVLTAAAVVSHPTAPFVLVAGAPATGWEPGHLLTEWRAGAVTADWRDS